MSSSNPLKLPEILSHVGKFVPLNHLPSCVLVSQAWRHAFTPYIWRHIVLDEVKPHLPETTHANSHLVKRIDFKCSVLQEHVALSYPNLESLHLTGQKQNKNSLKLILQHPTLTRLQLEHLWSDYQSAFWDQLLEFRYLRDLTLANVTVGEEDVDKFWQFCTQLERLDFRLIWSNQGNLSSMEFPCLKEIKIRLARTNEVPLSLEMIERCPNLRSLHWGINEREGDKQFVARVVQLITSGTWPELESIDSESYNLTNNDLSQIMAGMAQIKVLNIGCSWDAFGRNSTDLLRPHFSGLKELRLGFSITETGPLGQEIMSSCPLLEKLTVPRINAVDIVRGPPWVCLRLKQLSAKFCFHPKSVELLQPLVFDRLSKLIRLEDLCIDKISDDSLLIKLHLQETFDLRLVRGLGKLSTLRSLCVLSFLDTEQSMGQEEVDWMLKHWTSLADISGTFNMSEPRFDAKLRERLEDRGIRTKGSENLDTDEESQWDEESI
ncbi:hypothetical protein BGZ65_011212 [Modicella reniformis]|uniref:F-box domain-containing protein n=1 Tax=Modicella reniformis TaxID=1440133 RepID=A0A9P6MJS3_9FUNG|nr:hypothetical protein BGZ65_011212 [Modicella reniformis]